MMKNSYLPLLVIVALITVMDSSTLLSKHLPRLEKALAVDCSGDTILITNDGDEESLTKDNMPGKCASHLTKKKLIVKGKISFGDRVFLYGALTEVDLDNNVRCDVRCFQATKISQFIFPKIMTAVPDGFFDSCDLLKKVVLPPVCNTIGKWAFWSVTNLDIYYSGTALSFTTPNFVKDETLELIKNANIRIHCSQITNKFNNGLVPDNKMTGTFSFGTFTYTMSNEKAARLDGSGTLSLEIALEEAVRSHPVATTSVEIFTTSSMTIDFNPSARQYSYLSTVTSIRFHYANSLTLGSTCFQFAWCITSFIFDGPGNLNLNLRCMQRTSITSIVLPNTKYIAEGCFDTCNKLTTVTIPQSVSFGKWCFWSCQLLNTFYYCGNDVIGGTGNVTFGPPNDANQPPLTSVIVPSDFVGTTFNSGKSVDKTANIFISNGISFKFEGCRIFISGSGTISSTDVVSAAAPQKCITCLDKTRITEIDLASSGLSFGASAFQGCTSLSTVSIKSKTDFGENAFGGCASLTDFVYCSVEAPTGSASIFSGASSDLHVYVPYAYPGDTFAGKSVKFTKILNGACMKETLQFTISSKFTFSSNFDRSSLFSSSHHMSPSSEFTKSHSFNPSKFFEASTIFTKSSIFLGTGLFSSTLTVMGNQEWTSLKGDETTNESPSQLSPSAHFSRSDDFVETQLFDKSIMFSHSIQFERSSKFSKSFQHSRSKEFIMTGQYSSSREFVESDHFSRSAIFVNSRKFSQSKQYSVSKEFVATIQFSNTDKLVKSEHFSQSSKFDSSIKFSISAKFVSTEQYSQSTRFIVSNVFSQSIKFEQSVLFSQSSRFDRSNAFSQSLKFEQSGHFYQSIEFVKSTMFSHSINFVESKQLSHSDIFLYSDEFSQSTKFILSQLLSESSKFGESKHFSRSSTFEESGKFSQSEGFMESNRFSQSAVFVRSGKFSKSTIFEKTNQFKRTGTFLKSNRFVNSNQFSQSVVSLDFNKIVHSSENNEDEKHEGTSQTQEQLRQHSITLIEEASQTHEKLKTQNSNTIKVEEHEETSQTQEQLKTQNSNTIKKDEHQESSMIIEDQHTTMPKENQHESGTVTKEETKIQETSHTKNNDLTHDESLGSENKHQEASNTKENENYHESSKHIIESSIKQTQETINDNTQKVTIVHQSSQAKTKSHITSNTKHDIEETSLKDFDSSSFNETETRKLNEETNNESNNLVGGGKLNGGQITGIVIGVLIVIVILALIVFFMIFKRLNDVSIVESDSFNEAMVEEMDSVENIATQSTIATGGFDSFFFQDTYDDNNKERDDDSYEYQYEYYEEAVHFPSF